MKQKVKIILFFIAIYFAISNGSVVFSQTTAVNFICEDCHNVSHDLFSELDAGKVIVIVWVMPCPGCIEGAQAANACVQNFATSNPGEVLLYIVDDYANTSCLNLGNWAENNGITDFTPFSNAAINMADYGTSGMPKVVVLGGTSHTVYCNENNSEIDSASIANAINAALNPLSINELKANDVEPLVYPNPGTGELTLNIEDFGISQLNTITLTLHDVNGNEVTQIFKGKWDSELKTIKVNIADLSNGTYFVRCSSDKETKNVKIIVTN